MGLRTGELPKQDDGAVLEAVGEKGTAVKGHVPAAGNCAERRLAQAVAGVKDKRFTHGKTPRFRMEQGGQRPKIVKVREKAGSQGRSWFSPVTRVSASSGVK